MKVSFENLFNRLMVKDALESKMIKSPKFELVQAIAPTFMHGLK